VFKHFLFTIDSLEWFQRTLECDFFASFVHYIVFQQVLNFVLFVCRNLSVSKITTSSWVLIVKKRLKH